MPAERDIERLAGKVRRLRERLEDLEDLLELRTAVKRNAGKPGVSFEQLDMDSFELIPRQARDDGKDYEL